LGSYCVPQGPPKFYKPICECFVTGRLGRCHRVPVIRVRRLPMTVTATSSPRRTPGCWEARSGSTEGDCGDDRNVRRIRLGRVRVMSFGRKRLESVDRNQFSVRTPRIARFRQPKPRSSTRYAPPDSPQGSVRTAKQPVSGPGPRRLKAPSEAQVSQIYRWVNVTCVTPLGVLTASTSKRSSSPSSPSQSRSPRPRTMGAITMCM
jgi:hypothetical protein